MQALRAKEKQIAQVKIIAENSSWYPFTHYTFTESLQQDSLALTLRGNTEQYPPSLPC